MSLRVHPESVRRNPAPEREDEPSVRDQALDALIEAGFSRLTVSTIDHETAVVVIGEGTALALRTDAAGELLVDAGYDVIGIADGVLLVGAPETLLPRQTSSYRRAA
jgi:hypothetical protein